MVSEEQIMALRQELLARDESIFDLQATLMTVEAETKHRIERVQSASRDEIRKLQEQLRRVQNEANRLRIVQQLSNPIDTIDRRNILETVVVAENNNHNMDTKENRPTLTAAKNFKIPNDPSTSATATLPIQMSAGSRLAQQLLLLLHSFRDCCFRRNSSSSSMDLEEEELIVTGFWIQQGLSQILSSSNNSTYATCSDIDVVVWIMSEIMTTFATLQNDDHDDDCVSSSVPNNTQSRQRAEIVATDTNAKKKNRAKRQKQQELVLLFQCLQYAWSLSPRSCRFVMDTMMEIENKNEPQRQSHYHRRRQRFCHFRMKHSPNNDSQQNNQNNNMDDLQQRLEQEQTQQHIPFINLKQQLQHVQDELQNPTWTPSPPPHNTHATREQQPQQQPYFQDVSLLPSTTPVQSRFCQRFWEMMHSILIQPFNTSSSSSSLFDAMSIAVAVVQTWTFLCIHSGGSIATTLFPRNDGNSYPGDSQSMIDTLIERWIQMSRTLVHHVYTQQQHQKQQSHSKMVTTSAMNASNHGNHHHNNNNSNKAQQLRSSDWIPLRILHVQEIRQQQQQQQQEPTMSNANDLDNNQNSNIRNHNDTCGLNWNFEAEGTGQKELCFQMGLNWLAEIMRLFRTIWNLRSDMRDGWLEDTSTGRAARLLACVLDVLEKVITPNESFQSHSLAMECVVWLQALAAPQCATRGGMLLLRTQRNTTRSTSELWHRAMSAIAVAVHLLNVIVIRQQYDDHIPTSTLAITGLKLTPLRDELVRFLHGVLQSVQEDRRVWEIQGPDRQRKQRLVTFMGVLSECQDYFTSAAAVLVSIHENSTTICKVHPDIQAMLKLQLDELSMDHEEMMNVVT
jgi:hypothetical protein